MTSATPLNFFQIERIDNYVKPYKDSDGKVMLFQFMASQYTITYYLSIYTLLDVFSEIGGIYSTLFSIGLIFNMMFSYQLMVASLVRQLYHFRPKFKSEIK